MRQLAVVVFLVSFPLLLGACTRDAEGVRMMPVVAAPAPQIPAPSPTPAPASPSGLRWLNLPYPSEISGVVEWKTVELSVAEGQALELVAVECFLVPPITYGREVGATRCGLLLRDHDFPTGEAFQRNDDPDVVMLLAIVEVVANPLSGVGSGLGYAQQLWRWTPPARLFVPPRVAIGFYTDDAGPTLHARIWYRLWPSSEVERKRLGR
ncbi:MAG: hypothetical protein HY683_00060 [Chloroflexi bacterium]|nr:hypothetical protein [Chloroflexota bacterium]